MDETYKYDVALSFAGEDRKYVEEVTLLFFMITLKKKLFGEKPNFIFRRNLYPQIKILRNFYFSILCSKRMDLL